MRISDWSSDVCSSDLGGAWCRRERARGRDRRRAGALPTRFLSSSAQRSPGDLAVVEGMLLGAHDLDRLMALAGDEHDVAGARLVDRERDGGGTIGLDGAPGRGGNARPDGADDGQRVLPSWVVGGQESPNREARPTLAHPGPSGGSAR